MVDTIVIANHIFLSYERLEKWDHDRKTLYCFGNRHIMDMYMKCIPIQIDEDRSFTIYGTYFPPNYKYPEPNYLIQVSLPKLLFGNNYTMLKTEADIEKAIALLNQYLFVIPELEPVNIWDSAIYQIDLCFNHQVGERVPDYINALYKQTYPHRKTEPYPKQGVQFRSSVGITKFYDKGSEAKQSGARGILRQETSYRTTSHITKLLKTDDPTLRDINQAWITERLRKDLSVLKVDSLVCDRNLAFDILHQKYDLHTAMKLQGYLTARQGFDNKVLKTKGISKRTISRYEGLLRGAGISNLLTDSGIPLPPLSIDF